MDQTRVDVNYFQSGKRVCNLRGSLFSLLFSVDYETDLQTNTNSSKLRFCEYMHAHARAKKKSYTNFKTL